MRVTGHRTTATKTTQRMVDRAAGDSDHRGDSIVLNDRWAHRGRNSPAAATR